MSEYTPTTDEVRAIHGADEFGVPAPLGQPVPDFDRWLAGHDDEMLARAEKAEQELRSRELHHFEVEQENARLEAELRKARAEALRNGVADD